MYMPYLMCGYAATVILMLAGCYAISRTVPGMRGLRLLVAALFCGLTGIVLLAMRPVAPPWATIVLANEALFVCSLLIYSATADILVVRASFHRWGLAVLVVALAAMFHFTYTDPNLPPRLYIGSTCFAIFAVARAGVLFAYRDPVADPAGPTSALRSLVTILAWLQVCIAALQAAHILLTALYPPSGIVHMDIIQSGFTYLNLVMNAGAGFGLTWLALSLTRRDLHLIARTDGLTGLLNRRAFEEILARDLEHANRVGRSLTLLLVDIDRFKEVNDTWGHQAGDEVIRRVASALQNSLRPGDALSRFGGEEFVILLRDATPDHAEEVAGRLRASIAVLGDLPGSVRLTVSIGVAASRTHDAAHELLRRCDDAMYRSKRAGRNLVTVDRSLSDHTGAAAEASA